MRGRGRAAGRRVARWPTPARSRACARIGLDDADVVAAVTGDDEDNLVISLLAKQEFAVPRVVARVNNPKNEWMFNENWGVDVAVSTPHLLTALVEEAVSVGSLVRLLSFEGGRASLIEVTLAGDSPAVDCEIVDLDFPRDSTVVAVLRNDRVDRPPGRHPAAGRRRGARAGDRREHRRGAQDPHRHLSGRPAAAQPTRRCSRPPRYRPAGCGGGVAGDDHDLALAGGRVGGHGGERVVLGAADGGRPRAPCRGRRARSARPTARWRRAARSPSADTVTRWWSRS